MNKIYPSNFQKLISHHKTIFNNAYCELYKINLFGNDILYFKTGIFSEPHHYNGYKENDPMLITFIIKRNGNEYMATIGGGSCLTLNDGEYVGVDFSIPCVGSRHSIINYINEWQDERLMIVKEYKYFIENYDISNLKSL